jgi:predicted DNA-binding transcriptional regulator YafY
MYATGNKKMLNMLILEILKEYSDQEHRLTQQEIIRLLKSNYDMDCDRRSVKNNVMCLKELGYEISMEDGYYLLEREFDDAELRMLIDSVLFSKNLTQKQAKTLIEKLKGMGNRYFSAKVNHVSNLPELHHGDNKQLMYVLDTINEAISQHKKISFVYNKYGSDFKLHPKREEKYVVNPYQMVANNGFYYLIGNYDKYDDISHYRLDKMTCVEMLTEKVKPQNQVTGLEQGLNLPKHMAEHIYMFSGESVAINMLVDETIISELVDWFGNDFYVIEKRRNNQVLVRLKCNEQAFFYWALQYGPYVEVLEPVSLRSKIAEAVSEMNEKYHRNGE